MIGNYRDVIIEALKYCKEHKGLILYGYVIMSNHIHLIIQSKESKLSDLVRDFKKFTSKNILPWIYNKKTRLGLGFIFGKTNY